jgi:deazaflavin-dependent oxidoreductase (nitroreductase family)
VVERVGKTGLMAKGTPSAAKLPPPWFIHLAWRIHRALYRVSGGRFLWTPASKRGWGALHLTTVGRMSGKERPVILGYIEHEDDFVVLAMNGWDEGHPAWWLNLQAHPEATARLSRQEPFPVVARAAEGEERERLWQSWRAIERDLDAYAARRTVVTPVVVFERRPESASAV